MFKSKRLKCIDFNPSQVAPKVPEQNELTYSLHTAVKKYKLRESIPELISDGADINAIDYDGNTPLHLACLERCESHIIQYLIDGKATVDALNNSGQTPLDIACDKGHYELLPTILRGGAAVNRVIDIDGNTVLHKVFMNPHQTITPIQELLVRYGADLDAKNNFGKTPHDLALEAHNWLKIEWLLNTKPEKLNESQLSHVLSDSDAVKQVASRQLKVFGKYFAFKIAKQCPKMPVEIIRKQLHFLWGGPGGHLDSIIENVVTSFKKNYKPYV